MIYNGDSFEKIPGGDFFHEMLITGLVPFDVNHLLVSTMDNGIYLFNSEKGSVDDSFVDPALMEELISVQVPYLTMIDDLILVGTFNNGLYILDRTGNVLEFISETEGLADMTISHVYSDERLKGAGPLWIAHWKGVSKVETNNPFRYFTEKSGFDNLITDITYFNDRLFISTMGGLYQMVNTSSRALFVPVGDFQNHFRDLCVIEPVPGKEFLLVSGDKEFYVIDEQMRVTALEDLLINPPEASEDIEQISGSFYPGRSGKQRHILYGICRINWYSVHQGTVEGDIKVRVLTEGDFKNGQG